MSRQGGWDIPAEGSLRPGVDRPNTTIRFGAPPLPIAPATAPVAQEETTAYGLGGRLGRTGEVYQARSPRFPNREAVAMKMYPRATGVTAGTAELFARDAARASGLRHPHIVHVIEAGTLRDGTPFVTMEYLTGRTLEDQLNGRGAFLTAELLPLIRGAASALSAAHAAGLVHGQVRPDNIFIIELAGYESGFVKMLDFGARHLTAAYARSGRPLSARETCYFAPEQLYGNWEEAMDARVDQFALAAIAYRMLSGVNPPSPDGVGVESADGGPSGTAATAVMPLARRSPAVDAVVSKALSRIPQDRFESISLFLRAFEEALAGAALIATPGPTGAGHYSGSQAPAGQAPPGQAPPGQAPPMSGETARTARQPDVAPRPGSSPATVEESRAMPRRYPAIERPSLTQQFFQEGDLQEAARYDNAALTESDFSGSGLEFASFDRIPKRRAPLFIAVIALLIAAGGVAWWAGVRPPQSWRQSSWWTTLHLPKMEPPPPAPGAIPSAGTQPEPTPEAAGPAPSTTDSAPLGQPTTAAAPSAAVTPPTPALPSAAPDPSAAAPVGSSPDPAAAPGAPAEAEPDRPAAESPVAAPATVKRRPPARTSGSASPGRPTPRRRSTTGTAALRGFIWSPEKQSMVPAQGRASEPWPRTESPPAPPPSSAPPDTRPGPPPFSP